jgi:hypothetical protein
MAQAYRGAAEQCLIGEEEKPMTSDDEAIRKARAEQLRKQIEQLVSPKDTSEPENSEESTGETEAQAPKSESPREFIHRKMRKQKRQETAAQPAKDKDARS